MLREGLGWAVRAGCLREGEENLKRPSYQSSSSHTLLLASFVLVSCSLNYSLTLFSSISLDSSPSVYYCSLFSVCLVSFLSVLASIPLYPDLFLCCLLAVLPSLFLWFWVLGSRSPAAAHLFIAVSSSRRPAPPRRSPLSYRPPPVSGSLPCAVTKLLFQAFSFNQTFPILPPYPSLFW